MVEDEVKDSFTLLMLGKTLVIAHLKSPPEKASEENQFASGTIQRLDFSGFYFSSKALKRRLDFMSFEDKKMVIVV